MKNIDLGEFAIMPAYVYEILFLNNNGGNDVETRHALSLQSGCQNIVLFFLTDFQE